MSALITEPTAPLDADLQELFDQTMTVRRYDPLILDVVAELQRHRNETRRIARVDMAETPEWEDHAVLRSAVEAARELCPDWQASK